MFQEPVDIMEGLSKEAAERVATKLGFTGKQLEAVGFIKKFYRHLF